MLQLIKSLQNLCADLILSPSFQSEEFGAQSVQVMYPKLCCWSAAELGFELRSVCLPVAPQDAATWAPAFISVLMFENT